MEFAALEMARGLSIGLAELENDRWTLHVESPRYVYGTHCCQWGCPNVATHVHVLKKRWSDGCRMSEENAPRYKGGGVDARLFCDRHKRRGNCGLDDADANYIVAPVCKEE